jgi:hypothetical protein
VKAKLLLFVLFMPSYSCSTTPHVSVEMLQQHNALVPSMRPCPSYNLAVRKMFVEMLKS